MEFNKNDSLSKLTNFNKKLYSKLHGYDFIFYNSRLTGFYKPVWSKVKALQHVMKENYEFILWMDADAQFINFDVTVEQIFDKIKNLTRSDSDVIIACDKIGLNFGVAIFRNNQNTQDLLQKTMDKWWYQLHWQQEQISFLKSLEDAQQLNNLKVTYLSRYFFNTYLNNRLYYSWIAHTPNCQENCKIYAKILTDYAEKRFEREYNVTKASLRFENYLHGQIDKTTLLNNKTNLNNYLIDNRFIKNKCSKSKGGF